MSPQKTYLPRPEAVPAVRDFVREQVSGSPRVDEIVLIASELATNAVVHARSSFTVTIDNGDTIRLQITDRSTVRPVPVASPGSRGHGLHIIDKLADRWGIEPNETGKTIWVEIEHVPGAAEPAGMRDRM